MKKFYEQKWLKVPQGLNSHQLARRNMILSYLSSLILSPYLRICDLGSGTGWLSQELLAFGNVTGIEQAASGVSHACRAYQNVRFIQSDIMEYENPGAFDLVVSSEVIEHMKDQRAFLAKAYSLLSPHGWLLLTCPNGEARKNFPETLPGQQPIENWPFPRTLHNLVDEFFVVHKQETFFPGDLYQIILARKEPK